jgi:hypothetical protein
LAWSRGQPIPLEFLENVSDPFNARDGVAEESRDASNDDLKLKPY